MARYNNLNTEASSGKTPISLQLEELYGVTLSADLISEITDTVQDVQRWQNRPVEFLYPIVYLEAL
jgi:putative transposase